MAASKQQDADQGLQKTVDQAEDQGFYGTKVDPRPNSDYSLESGPDSPSALEQRADVAAAEAQALKDSSK